jgi:hypothetical protein
MVQALTGSRLRGERPGSCRSCLKSTSSSLPASQAWQKRDPNSQPYTLFFPSLPFLLGIRIFNYPPDLKIFPVVVKIPEASAVRGWCMHVTYSNKILVNKPVTTFPMHARACYMGTSKKQDGSRQCMQHAEFTTTRHKIVQEGMQGER